MKQTEQADQENKQTNSEITATGSTPTDQTTEGSATTTAEAANTQKTTKKQRPPRVKHFSRLTYWFSLAVALIVGVVAGAVFTAHQLTQRLAVTSETQQISQVYQVIKNNYYQKVNQKKLVSGAISGMLDSLDDPFSQYLTTEETSSLNDSISGSFQGIGAEVRQGKQAIEIVSPIKGSPAEKAGLKANDLITAINGHSTEKMTVDQAVSKIRGKQGTTVKLTIKRGTDSFQVSLKRAAIDQATVSGALSEKGSTVGVISITTFAENTASGMEKTVKKLRQAGATSFVIDLRGNPGGLMNSALTVSSMFLANKKVIMRVQDRAGQEDVYRASKKYDNGFKVTEPVAILIDDGSASAAEIFTAALQQSGTATVVGTKSYGKGTVQTVVPLSSTSEMKFTTAKWLTPNKTWINKKGITPDVAVAYPELAKLSIISSDKTLQAGDVSDQVKLLQKNLQGLGYTLTNTKGVYDDSTVAAVKQLQTQAKLPVTGVFNEQTRLALYQAVATYLQGHDQMLDQAIAKLTATGA
ncbi:S41 family peptidase [Lapidilactobacillus luobeiensis]|uniref:S41 family peptidase n=1 Tax=Lapidilactobacillus luobeiensis TaxID=2950371 RepID=UPI0021C39A2D|nr:S41 family peptidase [Lapidilactobacillus luobeiensis]